VKLITQSFVVLLLLLAGTVSGVAQSREEMEKWLSGLQLQQGQVIIQNGSVTIDLPDAYRFIGKEDAKKILEDLWRNPSDPTVIGMIVKKDFSPTRTGSWVVVMQDDPSGYVSDKDASSIDYDEMMLKLKAEAPEINKQRAEKGFPSVDIIGWAERPYYDQQSHKLYWAKQLKFTDNAQDTLNYDVRILGRKGVLQLSAIAGIDQLEDVKANMPSILNMVNFKEGSRYVDFDPNTDKMAGYGLAALVAGGIAAKAGLFKGLLIALLAFKKFIIMGFVALAAYFKRIMAWVKGIFGKKAP